MKFKCIYKDIQRAVASISKVNIKSNLFPITEMVHIEASDNIITFRATNLEVILEISINAKVEMMGKVVISFINLNKIINIVKSDIVDLELIDNMLHVISGRSKIKLQTMIYEEIPTLPVIDNNTTQSLTINKNIFVKAIKQVSFAVANTEIKPEISSIYIYTKDNYLYTVATDTFRLAENRINIDNLDIKFNLMIPGKNVNVLVPIIDNIDQEDIEINNYEDGIIINSNNVFLAVRTINGNYPDYAQLFPREWLGTIDLNKADLVANLNATTLFKDNYSYSNLRIDNNLMHIETKNNNIGSYESEIEIQNNPIEGKDLLHLEANYNSSLLLEGINKMDSNNIHIYFTSPNKPIFIKSDNNNDFTYLLMPLNR